MQAQRCPKCGSNFIRCNLLTIECENEHAFTCADCGEVFGKAKVTLVTDDKRIAKAKAFIGDLLDDTKHWSGQDTLIDLVPEFIILISDENVPQWLKNINDGEEEE